MAQQLDPDSINKPREAVRVMGAGLSRTTLYRPCGAVHCLCDRPREAVHCLCFQRK